MTIASPTAASAAATVKMNITNMMAIGSIPHTGKGHEGEIDGIEHQLDGHEDDQRATAEQDTHDPDQKEHGAEHEVIGDRHHGDPLPSALRQHNGANQCDKEEDRGKLQRKEVASK